MFVRPHLARHFRALDQTCKDVFSCEDLFRVLGKSGCTAVFSILGMRVSVSFRPADNLCCETSLGGGTFLCPGPNLRGHFFLARTFIGSSGNVDVFLARTFFGSSENVCVFL